MPLTGGSSVDLTLTQEQVQDLAWDIVTGTQTLITVTYQDASDNVDFIVENDLSLYDNSSSLFLTTVDDNDVVPLTASFSYNGDGTINTLTKDGRVSTFAYNGDGTIDTITNTDWTKTFAYNGDGTIDTVTVT